MIDHAILQQRPDVTIEGLDVLVRPKTPIPVRPFDGVTLPFAPSSFDVVMFADVLHHTTDPRTLLREAARVGRAILIKDHRREGFLAGPTLRFMDWVGNAHHGVTLPYNYWSEAEWASAFEESDLKVIEMKKSVCLYHPPASWLFDRGLHFIARLERA